MKREEWVFQFPANEILAAAQKKRDFHAERRDWWENQRHNVMLSIKSSGITIDESMATEILKSYSNIGRQPSVRIDPEMLADLQECNSKITEHRQKYASYVSFVSLLQSQGNTMLPMNKDDWLFFFSENKVDNGDDDDDDE